MQIHGENSERGTIILYRHCEPTDRRKAPSDDRLREAIQKSMDCFVALLLAMTEGGYSAA
jgi:hypothetical protein